MADISCIRCSIPSANTDLKKSILEIVLQFASFKGDLRVVSSNTMIWPNALSVILPAAFSIINALNLPTPLNQTEGIPLPTDLQLGVL